MSYRNLTRLLIVAALFIMNCGGGGETQSSEGWLAFNEGMALAAKTHRPVVIDFYTSWCKWCKVMDKETFSDSTVVRYLSDNFVAIRINAENRTEQLKFNGRTYTPVELTKSFKVRGYPSLAYLDKEGKLITVMPGFQKPDTFLPTLKYIKSECYKKNVSLQDFISNGGCGE